MRRFLNIYAALCMGMGFVLNGVSMLHAEDTLPPLQEERAKALFTQLRCVVCQNQSIGGSEADVAKDLRLIVREQIAAGKTDDEVRSFLVDRYGEFILLKPTLGWHTALLWGSPILLLGIGALFVFVANKNRSTQEKSSLSTQQEADLKDILNKDF